MRILALLTLLSLIYGCKTTTHRANQYGEAFAQLTPEEQQQVENGEIKIGDSREMVYIALGPPQESKVIDTDKGKNTGEQWLYVGTPESEQQTPQGKLYRFNTVNDFSLKNSFSSSKTNRIRIIFENEKVTNIETFHEDDIPRFNRTLQPILLPQSPQLRPVK